MPYDSSTEPETRRLLTDGSVRPGRPAPPAPTGARPAAERAGSAPDADAPGRDGAPRGDVPGADSPVADHPVGTSSPANQPVPDEGPGTLSGEDGGTPAAGDDAPPAAGDDAPDGDPTTETTDTGITAADATEPDAAGPDAVRPDATEPDAVEEPARSTGTTGDDPTEGPEATVVIPAVDDRPVHATPAADAPAADGPAAAPPVAPSAPPAPESAAYAAPDAAEPVPDVGDTIEYRRDDLSAFSRVSPDAPAEPARSTAPIGLTAGALGAVGNGMPVAAGQPAGPAADAGPRTGSAGSATGPVDDSRAGGEGPPPAGTATDDGPVGPSGDGRSWWRRRAVLLPAAAVLGLAAVYGADLAIAGGDVPRGTVVAGLDLGGLSPAAAADRLTDELAPRMTADHPLVADDVQAVLHPPAAGISLDVPATVDAVDDQPLNPWTRLMTLVSDREVDPVVTEDETALAAQLEQLAAQVDRAPVDATIALEGTDPQVVEPVAGRTLDREGAAAAITEALATGGDPATPIELPVEVADVRVDAAEAQRVLDETVTPALSGPVTVVGADGADSVEVPVSAIAAALTFEPQDDGTLATAVDPVALQTEMGSEFEVFGSPAQDARFEVSGGTISVVPSVDGQGIDPAVLAEQLLPVLTAAAPRQVSATLGPVPAAFTTEQAEALGITEEVSSFTTNFTNAASGTNIRVVAGEVDGAIVRPGETFSLNTFTGPRGTAQGYVPAGVISNGEFSTAVGGGISQFATTMFNAVFFAGLEDVYHKPHSYYISRYPAGREATVYEGAIDLQWRNDTETGIYVQTEWVPGALTVRFWGTKYYEIESLSSERYGVTEPVVQEKVDDGSCSPQGGSTGFGITVTRVFNDAASGAEIRREEFRTRYAAEPVIRCVPPPPAPADPAGAPPPAPATPTG